ncbi:hypothetical protein [Oxynema aestuarii]|nr:hypothetical protein [Oxynema aestuarii]
MSFNPSSEAITEAPTSNQWRSRAAFDATKSQGRIRFELRSGSP